MQDIWYSALLIFKNGYNHCKDNSSSGNPEGFEWGNGNGEVPPGQNVDEDGNIVNNGGHMPPGLNRRNKEKLEKPDNPNKPEKPDDPGNEESSDKNANKAQKGTHIYIYDELNRMVSSDIAKEKTTYLPEGQPEPDLYLLL